MSKPPESFPTPQVSSTLSQPERLFRINWNERVARGDGGVPTLPPEFVVEQGRSVQLVDVRDGEELTGPLGHIPGVSWVPLADIERFDAFASGLDHDTPLVLISRTGERAGQAARALESRGFRYVVAMRGGMVAWKNLGYATARDASVLERRAAQAQPLSFAAAPPPHLEAGPIRLSLDDIRDHVGDPRAVRRVKMAARLLHGKTSCVDGRDDHGVIGAPGGDSGEFLLALATVEAVTGRPFDIGRLPGLLLAYLDTFGHFYMHTDIPAVNRVIAGMRQDARLPEAELPSREAPPTAWRRFMTMPPQHLRAAILDYMLVPENQGCGHLKFMMQFGDEYGVRRALATEFLRLFHTMRWQGTVEMEFAPLGGGHQEGAVVNVRLEEEVWPFTKIPLVSPSCGGKQMFVYHPQAASFLRRQVARFMTTRPETGLSPGDMRRFADELEAIAGRQLVATLGRLAKGLPIFDILFLQDGNVDITQSGVV